jgi:phage gpG-like protein
MAGPLFDISQEGSDEIFAQLQRIALAADADEVADEVAELQFKRTFDRFLNKKDPDGVPWPPSKEAALRQSGVPRKSGFPPRKVTGGDTMLATGDLLKSIIIESQGQGIRTVQSTSPYGRFHDTGTRFHPPRKFLGFGIDDVEAATALVARRLINAITGASI